MITSTLPSHKRHPRAINLFFVVLISLIISLIFLPGAPLNALEVSNESQLTQAFYYPIITEITLTNTITVTQDLTLSHDLVIHGQGQTINLGAFKLDAGAYALTLAGDLTIIADDSMSGSTITGSGKFIVGAGADVKISRSLGSKRTNLIEGFSTYLFKEGSSFDAQAQTNRTESNKALTQTGIIRSASADSFVLEQNAVVTLVSDYSSSNPKEHGCSALILGKPMAGELNIEVQENATLNVTAYGTGLNSRDRAPVTIFHRAVSGDTGTSYTTIKGNLNVTSNNGNGWYYQYIDYTTTTSDYFTVNGGKANILALNEGSKDKTEYAAFESYGHNPTYIKVENGGVMNVMSNGYRGMSLAGGNSYAEKSILVTGEGSKLHVYGYMWAIAAETKADLKIEALDGGTILLESCIDDLGDVSAAGSTVYAVGPATFNVDGAGSKMDILHRGGQYGAIFADGYGELNINVTRGGNMYVYSKNSGNGTAARRAAICAQSGLSNIHSIIVDGAGSQLEVINDNTAACNDRSLYPRSAIAFAANTSGNITISNGANFYAKNNNSQSPTIALGGYGSNNTNGVLTLIDPGAIDIRNDSADINPYAVALRSTNYLGSSNGNTKVSLDVQDADITVWPIGSGVNDWPDQDIIERWNSISFTAQNNVEETLPFAGMNGNTSFTLSMYGRIALAGEKTPAIDPPQGDVIVTKNFETVDGTTVKDSVQSILNTGDVFTDPSDSIEGYTYVGYKFGFQTSSTKVFRTLRDTTSSTQWLAKYLGGPNVGTPSQAVPDEKFPWESQRTYTDGSLNATGYTSAHTITTERARQVHWNVDIPWISAASNAVGANGYYSYVTVLDSLPSNQALSFNGLHIGYASDDHLHAIIVNGVRYDGYTSQAMNYPGWIQNHTNILLKDIPWNIDGPNTIEFIVHNNNSNAYGDFTPSAYGNVDNATGFSATIEAIVIASGSGMEESPLFSAPAEPDIAVACDLAVTYVYEINTYGVTYDGNGSDGGDAPVDANSSYEHGSTVTVLDQGTLIKTNHKFQGWATSSEDATAGIVTYATGATFSIKADTTLYAVWGEKPQHLVTVKYLDRHGYPVGSPSSTSFYKHVDEVFDVTVPTFDEYMFVRWNETPYQKPSIYHENTDPFGIIMCNGPMEIVLYYGHDRGKTGDTPGEGTPDGIEDAVVTKKFATIDGITLKDSTQLIINEGDIFSDPHDAIDHYTYVGYKMEYAAKATSITNMGSVLNNNNPGTTVKSIWIGGIEYSVPEEGLMLMTPMRGGAKILPDGTFMYVAPNANGTDSFQYYATDEHGVQSELITVTIEVRTIDPDEGAGHTLEPTLFPAPAEPNYTIASDITVTYVYELNSHTVAVNYVDRQGNSLKTPDSLTKDYNETFNVTVPAIPDYVFVNWELDSILQNNTDPTGLTMGDVPVVITLIYGHDRGKTGEPGDNPGTPDGIEDMLVTKTFEDENGVALKTGTTIIVNVGDVFADAHDVIPGYTFVGHKVDGGALAAGEPNVAISDPNNITVTYVYEETPQHTVTYDGNDNDEGEVFEDLNSPYYHGSEVTVLGHGDLIRNNHSFHGWATSVDGTVKYTEGDIFSITESIILYAVWLEDAKYSVTYDANNATSGKAPVDSTHYYRDALAAIMDQGSLLKANHTFLGWSDDPSSSTATHIPDYTFSVNGNTILYAVWSENTKYVVTYQPGAHGTFSAQSSSVYLGDPTPAVPAVTGERGWAFTGWTPEPGITVTGNATFVAQWEESTIMYTVRFVDWNGTLLKSEQVAQGGNATAPRNPAMAGWIFTGWSHSLNNIQGDITIRALYASAYKPGQNPDPDPDPTPTVEEEPASPEPPRKPAPAVPSDSKKPAQTAKSPIEMIKESNVPVISIGNNEIPLVGLPGVMVWALVNLILCVLGVILAIITLNRVIIKKRQDDDNEKQRKTRKTFLIITAVLAVAGVILFLLTEDMRNLMVLLDAWTIVSLVIFVAEIIGVVFVFKRSKNKDNDDFDYTDGDRYGYIEDPTRY
ncbi:MAG: InlB B-repeat-containing protein [Peptococcaceae bacterium]|nr:InlB B-repeat-containing protein [Peptococcaceae bacterium]